MSLKGYRTIIWNVVNALGASAELLMPVLGDPTIQSLVPHEWLPYWMLLYAAVNVILRLDTDTPVGQKRG